MLDKKKFPFWNRAARRGVAARMHGKKERNPRSIADSLVIQLRRMGSYDHFRKVAYGG